MSERLTLTAYIRHFIYRNADNGYGVATLVPADAVSDGAFPDDEEIEITAVGTLRGCDVGDLIEVTGTTTVHPAYGEQIRIESFRVIPPTDAVSAERYLASGAIKGIGEKLAHRIVRKFGDDTFRVMEEEPERLAELKGISERMAMEIGGQIREKKRERETEIFLQEIGITGQTAVRVIRTYGADTCRIIRENPYRLAAEIEGIGFHTADEIAVRMGIEASAEFRVESGICYALVEAAVSGHSFLPHGELLEKTRELLGLTDTPEIRELLESRLAALAIEHSVVIRSDEVYLEKYHYEEQAIAGMLADLHRPESVEQVSPEELEAVQQSLDIELDDMQKEAVSRSLSSGVLILTGGPGTGKTTTMGAILQIFENRGMTFVLAAPTGRAAKRMTETTGYEARTIHRLLEVSAAPQQDGQETLTGSRARFSRNRDNPLEADAVIIDEMSMVDMHLFYSLLRACVPGMHLILIGDDAQLPSVGTGQVLHDLIVSGSYPVVQLTRIFRQATQSDIVMNAHRVLAGEPLALDNKSRDFFFLAREDPADIRGLLVLLIRDKLPPYVHAEPQDIQVLVPMRRGPLGAISLNKALQSALNPPSPKKKEWQQGERIWRVGDKVMQTKNDYNAVWEVHGRNGIVIDHGEGIFNGDLGKIVDIDRVSQEVTILFDENRRVCVPFSSMEDVDHAFAMTIHKAQGSEYPAVILPLLGGPRMLLNRNLLYTAITRAKSAVVLTGSREVIREMAENTEEMKRHTGLADRIREIR